MLGWVLGLRPIVRLWELGLQANCQQDDRPVIFYRSWSDGLKKITFSIEVLVKYNIKNECSFMYNFDMNSSYVLVVDPIMST